VFCLYINKVYCNLEKRGDKKHVLKHLYYKIKSSYLLFFISFGIWSLFRIGMRPTRILYPCQMTFWSGLGTYVSSIFSSFLSNFSSFLRRVFTLKNIVTVVSLIIVFFTITYIGEDIKDGRFKEKLYGMTGFSVFEDKVHDGLIIQNLNVLNGGSGLPKVVSIHDSGATFWDFSTGWHGDYIRQDRVNTMVETGVKELTGETTLSGAWNRNNNALC